MTDEMKKRWVCPKCDQDSTNEYGACDGCLVEASNDTGIPTDVIQKYAVETGDDDLDDLEEAYSGKFDSDRDFAMDMADNIGSVDFKNQPWPQYCIDWDYAARELMYDYFEIDGHYFRNL